MTAPVKLPRRLPDRGPVRSDPPTEADWLRRAIRHCERWSAVDAVRASMAAFRTKPPRTRMVSPTAMWADWLPEHLRRVPLGELHRMLAALEAEEPTP